MALAYKNIVITPNTSSSTGDPTIAFQGANVNVNSAITLYVYPDSNGTLSFEGSAGQLFSITNDLTGSIFSVNDVSGLPLIEANVTSQQITLGQFYGNVGVGTANAVYKLDVAGAANISFPTLIVAGQNVINLIVSDYAATNAAYTTVNAAFAASNAEYTFSNTIYAAVNSAFATINAAYGSSNSDYTLSNTIYASVNSNWTVTNTVYGVANAAFAKANTGLANTAATVFLGSANTTTLFNGASSATFASSLRANRNITGGGDITYDSSANVYWSARFIVIANGRGTNFATAGYFDINCPTSGTVTGVGGASSVTATASGIPLAAWTALYYILPIGSGNTSLAANFRVVSYTSDVDVPHDWVLICFRNGDDNLAYFNNGVRLAPGSTSRQSAMSASLGASGVILENRQTIAANYTMTTNYSGMSAGPITINTGVSVTIPTGSNWVIV